MTFEQLCSNLNEDFTCFIFSVPYIEDRLSLLRSFPNQTYEEMQQLHRMYKQNPLPYVEILSRLKKLIAIFENLGFDNIKNDVKTMIELFLNQSISSGYNDYINTFKQFEKKCFNYILTIQNFIAEYGNPKVFGAIELYKCIDADFFEVLATHEQFNQETQFLTEFVKLDQSGLLTTFHSYIKNKQVEEASDFFLTSGISDILINLHCGLLLSGMLSILENDEENYQGGLFIVDMQLHNLIYAIHKFRTVNKI